MRGVCEGCVMGLCEGGVRGCVMGLCEGCV